LASTKSLYLYLFFYHFKQNKYGVMCIAQFKDCQNNFENDNTKIIDDSTELSIIRVV